MFNLEQSIADWRRQMLAAGIETPALDELESHLREEIGRQKKLSDYEAFRAAVKVIGSGPDLGREFRKVGESLPARFVRLVGIGCGAISLMLSLWCVQFLFFQTNLTTKFLGITAVAISIFCWKYSFKFLPAIRYEFIRSAIGLACCIAGVIWIQLFIKECVPVLAVQLPGQKMAQGQLLAAVLWACTAMAVLSSIGYGLEKAARERRTVEYSQ